MTDRLFPSALRELRTDLTKRPVLVGMLALGVILGISGPFNTLDVLPAVPRTAYWIAVVAISFAAGSLVSIIVHRTLDMRLSWLAHIASAVAIGFSVTIILSIINLTVFGLWFDTWAAFLAQLGMVTLISAVVEFSSLALQSGHKTNSIAPVKLLERLPFEKRGKIMSLSAEDHYVRITTTKGSELVLMRLSDAVKEVGDTVGLQIHRSHWIAVDQVTKVNRISDRAEAHLADGTTRPISRGYMAAARDAGLFPTKPKS